MNAIFLFNDFDFSLNESFRFPREFQFLFNLGSEKGFVFIISEISFYILRQSLAKASQFSGRDAKGLRGKVGLLVSAITS